MARLNVPVHKIDRFTFVPASNMLVTEASDLGRNYGGRLYDDACDYGFSIVSPRTNRVVLFVLAHEERDREGDVYWEDYKPADADAVALADLTVRIYND